MLPEAAIVSPGGASGEAPKYYKVTRPQPYYSRKPGKATAAIGEFSAGEKLLLLAYNGGEFCRVEEANGTGVYTAFATLESL